MSDGDARYRVQRGRIPRSIRVSAGRWSFMLALGHFRSGWDRQGDHAGSFALPFLLVTYLRRFYK